MAPHVSVGQYSRVSYSFALSLAFFLMSSVNTAASSARSAWLGVAATMQLWHWSIEYKTEQNSLTEIVQPDEVLPPNATDLSVFFPDLGDEFAPLTFLKKHAVASGAIEFDRSVAWDKLQKKAKKKEKEEQKIGYPHACWGMKRLQMRLTNS